MPLTRFKVIHGRFVITGYEPDGDSMRFIANDITQYDDLHRAYKIMPSKRDGSVQLRFEGIDAPETHYGSAAQPLGDVARDALLKLVGFDHVDYGGSGNKVISSSPAEVAGCILTKGAEVHGRPIAYILIGRDHRTDGSVINVDSKLLKQTLNYQLVEQGHVYSLLYSSTPLPHRKLFRTAAKTARNANLGVWSFDETSSFILDNQASIDPNGALIFPKLFRRCTDFLKTAGGQAEPGFDLGDWLAANPMQDDQLYIETSSGKPIQMHLSGLIEQRNHRVTVQGDILDVVFIEK